MDYQEAPAYFDLDGNYHGTSWGSLFSGYNFAAGSTFGDQSLSLGPNGFTTQGRAVYVNVSRNGVTIGEIDDVNSPPYPAFITSTVNGSPVPFATINLNSYAQVLCQSRSEQPSHFGPIDCGKRRPESGKV